MAGPATSRRTSAARRPAAKKARRPTAKTAKTTTEVVKTAGRTPAGRGLAGAAARKGLELIGRRALRSGAEAVRAAATHSAELSRRAFEAGANKRAPVQVSVDVAVPLKVAWDEWMTFSSLTEGIHQIDDVEREGDALIGRTAGSRPSDWAADILDEREQQSFAWRSVEGSDCAGLVTFHRLGDRLTRVELDLDVLPTRPGEALSLTLHLADRRAETDLRRFKAAVEFINPDVYEEALVQNGNRSKRQRKRPRDD